MDLIDKYDNQYMRAIHEEIGSRKILASHNCKCNLSIMWLARQGRSLYPSPWHIQGENDVSDWHGKGDHSTYSHDTYKARMMLVIGRARETTLPIPMTHTRWEWCQWIQAKVFEVSIQFKNIYQAARQLKYFIKGATKPKPYSIPSLVWNPEHKLA